MFLENQLGRFLGDFFDLHAAFGADHQHGFGRGAIEHDAQVQLASDIAACFDEDSG